MGFVLNQFVLIGGSEEFPIGDTYELRLSRAKTILTKAVQTIIACNQGWELDTSKNATDTDYTNIPTESTGEPYYPGLFLRNSISGCKLFIGDFPGSYIAYCCNNFDGKSSLLYSQGYTNHLGICLSIIPGESESEFGNDPNAIGFFPDDATRFCGTYYRDTTNYTEKSVIGSNPRNGWSYMYGFGVTPYVITTFANHDESGYAGPYNYYVPIYACGRIFGELAHKEDNLPTAKYGVVLFRKETSQYEAWAQCFSTEMSGFGSTNYYVPWNGFSNPSCGSITKANGEWIRGGQNAVVMFTFNWTILANTLYYQQNSTAWSAIGIGRYCLTSSDLTANGIVPGDGFKGLLDTDLFRAGRGTAQQTFDNGQFFCPESNVGLFVGVDNIIA